MATATNSDNNTQPTSSRRRRPSAMRNRFCDSVAPTKGYKVLRADMTALIDPSCAYSVGATTTLPATASIRPGHAGLHYGRTPLDCAVDMRVRAALARSFPPLDLAFVEVEATGIVVCDGGCIATDALRIVRRISADEWRRMCTGTVAVHDADGSVRVERYRESRLHSLPDPTLRCRSLPAIEWPDGQRDWYVDGLRHRCDCAPGDPTCAGNACVRLPAIIEADGTRHWYARGLPVDPLAVRASSKSVNGNAPLSPFSLARWCVPLLLARNLRRHIRRFLFSFFFSLFVFLAVAIPSLPLCTINKHLFFFPTTEALCFFVGAGCPIFF
ncbi:hypothetical protein TW95_gp1834 [Pandoravirus inopinatum]|uniref:Uncharacterized protein n=1 Tax=Pandoravirus inopinatum TaxID=1605721 RepID=A0A0B5J027_9VIRU|nr:hypothetical protein TW95_gp1834 [Pandoravirus inopinatum]AJF98568.1 hypothetical protein [Pandoravirus inopinatum]